MGFQIICNSNWMRHTIAKNKIDTKYKNQRSEKTQNFKIRVLK